MATGKGNTLLEISDAVAPAKAVKRLLEKDVQKQCVDWARAQGFWVRKFSSMTQRSVPDYLFSRVGWPMFAIEFKAPGKVPTPAQIDEIEMMRRHGWYVQVCDDFEMFKAFALALRDRRNADTR